MLFVGCDRCGRVECSTCPVPHDLLLAQVDRDRFICSDCWRAEGMHWPRFTESDEDVALGEAETRKRMQARKGADAHLVRSGKS